MWQKYEYAKCFGNWDISNSECIKCAVSDGCEKRTKNKAVEIPEKFGEEVDRENVKGEDISPLIYLIQSLDGKFDKEEEKKGGARVYKFRSQGKLKTAVIIGESGKIKVVSFNKRFEKVFDYLEGIEQVENILKEII